MTAPVPDSASTTVPWQARVLTLYPEMFPGPLGHALAGRALAEKLWSLEAIDVRRFARDKHGSVDDHPFGGGPGMVMRPDVLADAIDATRLPAPAPLVYLSARGHLLTQARVREIASGPGVTLICGRFEGVDQRVLDARAVEELSLGDYVLSGGEIAALALLDACVRLLPGVIGQAESLAEESFEAGLLEYPHYTRPQEFEGRAVPEVLRSGNHARIRAWRQAEAERTTRERRSDLWSRFAETRASRA